MPPAPIVPAPEGFPGEFPSAHVAEFGRHVLAAVVSGKFDPRSVAESAAFPAWVVLGYGGHMLTTGGARPIFGSPIAEYSDEDLATLLVDSAERPRFGGASYADPAAAIPWSLVLTLALKVFEAIRDRRERS